MKNGTPISAVTSPIGINAPGTIVLLATEASDATETFHADESIIVRDLEGAWAEASLLALDGDRALQLVSALGGVDTVLIGDMSGTDFRRAAIDLSGPAGGGDQAADTVTIEGTARADRVSVSASWVPPAKAGAQGAVAVTFDVPTSSPTRYRSLRTLPPLTRPVTTACRTLVRCRRLIFRYSRLRIRPLPSPAMGLRVGHAGVLDVSPAARTGSPDRPRAPQPGPPNSLSG